MSTPDSGLLGTLSFQTLGGAAGVPSLALVSVCVTEQLETARIAGGGELYMDEPRTNPGGPPPQFASQVLTGRVPHVAFHLDKLAFVPAVQPAGSERNRTVFVLGLRLQWLDGFDRVLLVIASLQ